MSSQGNDAMAMIERHRSFGIGGRGNMRTLGHYSDRCKNLELTIPQDGPRKIPDSLSASAGAASLISRYSLEDGGPQL
jgi:hypothetical protein